MSLLKRECANSLNPINQLFLSQCEIKVAVGSFSKQSSTYDFFVLLVNCEVFRQAGPAPARQRNALSWRRQGQRAATKYAAPWSCKKRYGLTFLSESNVLQPVTIGAMPQPARGPATSTLASPSTDSVALSLHALPFPAYRMLEKTGGQGVLLRIKLPPWMPQLAGNPRIELLMRSRTSSLSK